MEELAPIFANQFPNLPKEIQGVFESGKLDDVLSSASTENNLNDDQQASVFAETLFVLMGNTKREDFQTALKEQADVTDEIAKKVADTIAVGIFDQVKNTLVKVRQDAEKRDLEIVAGTIKLVPDTNTDHQLPAGEEALEIEAPIPKSSFVRDPINKPAVAAPASAATTTVKPITSPLDAPWKTAAPAQGPDWPKVTRTLEGDLKQAGIVDLRTTKPTTLPKKEHTVAPPDAPKGPDPYRESPTA